MKKIVRIRGFLFILCILLTFLSSPTFAKVKPKTDVDKDVAMKKVSGLQIPFIENQGQIKDKSVKFYANTFAGTVFVMEKGEIVYSMIKAESKEDARYKMQDTELKDKTLHLQTKTVAIKESLEYPSQNTDKIKITGINKSETKVNYFVGTKDNWRTDIPTWQAVSFGEVYKGIELKLKAYGKNVEKLFTVHPRSSVDDIKLKIEGAKGLKVNKDGELEVETELGTIKYTKPIAYQEIDGKMVEVAVDYIIPQSETHNQQFEYAFKIGNYDRTKELVIDPLLASTFLGGNSSDEAYALDVDSSGNVFVAGRTCSTNFPTSLGAYDRTLSGCDAFISKFDGNLTNLLVSTFLGGSTEEYARSIYIDNGNIYVSGYSNSSNFPTTLNAYDNSYNDGYYGYDIFVSKLDNNLSTLLASTFLGGSKHDYGRSLALDSSGNIFVSGYTYSTNFPTTINSYDNALNGEYDAFISKLDSNLTTLLASTFLGGSDKDEAYAISLNSDGNILIIGDTFSTDYPTTSGAYDTSHNGYFDAFVSKLDSNLSTLLASTFLGGDTYDYGWSLAIDPLENIFVTGMTFSYNYPTTSGAYDTSHNGTYDVFISKLNSNLTTLYASTFIGGNNHDYGRSIDIDSLGNIFVTGPTFSYNYPTTPEAYDIYHYNDYGFGDVFISKLNNNLTTLLSSTFIGGESADDSYAISIDPLGNIFVVGYTHSYYNYPTTQNAYDTSHNGNYGFSDAFVSKLDNNLSAIDSDSDSYLSNVDCDDNDPLVNPGAIEICDGVDNNCDSSVDEGCNIDLYISSMSAPGSANGGQTISVSDTTNKSGVSLVGTTTTKIYFSKDNKYSASDTYLSSRTVPGFGAGAQSSSGSTSVTIPSNACTQTYYLIARADANQVIPEWNEGNNNRTIAIGITNPTPSVDLYISSVSAPASANAGQTISVSDTTNKSGPCASGALTTKIYLSTDNKYSTSDIYLGERAVGAFDAGAGISSGSTNVTIPAGTPAGSYYIIVRADADKVIPEWNEGNNNRAGAITITSP